MRWIPCSERLPEEFQAVLVLGKSGNKYQRGCEVSWITPIGWVCWFTSDITHWMPLPELPQEKKQLRIYIASAYSAPTEAERLANTYRAIDAGIRLRQKGHIPFIPHLCHWWDARAIEQGIQFTWKDWMDYDDVWLAECDAFLYLSPSRGADIELARAKELGLRIFYSVEEVEAIT